MVLSIRKLYGVMSVVHSTLSMRTLMPYFENENPGPVAVA